MRQLLASYLCALPVHLAGGLGRASCSHDDVTTLLSSQRLHHDAAIGEITFRFSYPESTSLIFISACKKIHFLIKCMRIGRSQVSGRGSRTQLPL